MKQLHEKTMALAGVFQAAALVNHIATKGVIDDSDLATCVNSTLQIDPINTEAVFGKIKNIHLGLATLIEQIADKSSGRDVQMARYVIALLHLQRKLMKQPAMLQLIQERIRRAQQQADIFTPTHDNVIANLAGIYSDTISQIRPKIIVSGEETYLGNPKNANRIRTVLLAGIRAAVLWEQLGGSRWQILWKRRAIVQAAKELLEINP
jgi:high frequency lysogenization protein